MNIKILESLIKLFAISFNIDDNKSISIAKSVLKDFLYANVEEKYIGYYINEFENIINNYNSLSNKKISLNSVRIIHLCKETANTLSRTERLQLYFYLINLNYETGRSSVTSDFVKLVGDCYGFDETIFYKISEIIADNSGATDIKLLIDDTHIANYLLLEDVIIFKPYKNNKFKINNEKCISGKTYFLVINSVVIYDNEKKYFYHDFVVTKEQNPFYLKMEDIQVKIKNKTLLHKLSINIKSGELIGIIGKSGSGKTTLLKTINGTINKFYGKISYFSINEIEKTITKAFVSQSNYFIPLFSVEEHLVQRAEFLQISTVTGKRYIEKILESVNLENKINNIAIRSDNSIYQLSGGELKRLAIAMELLAEPDVLLLDEPTSGLASNDALKIISLLKEIALQNKIIITSIHQPDYETFMMFDKILIIDDLGHPVYFNTPSYAIEYFRNISGRIDKNSLLETYFNPSVLLKLIDEKEYDENGNITNIRKRSPEFWYEKFLKQKDIINKTDYYTIKIEKGFKKQNFIKSVIQQLKFSLKIDIKNYVRLLLLILLPFFVGLLFSIIVRYPGGENYIYYNNPNIPAWIIIILITSVFTGLVSSGHEFIYLRYFHNTENRVINKNITLTISKIIKYSLLSCFQSFLLILTSVVILEVKFHFINLFLICWMLTLWGSLLGLILSAICKNTTIVYLIIPLIIIPQMIFSGALIQFENFNPKIKNNRDIPFIADFIPLRWASEAVITDLYLNNDYEKEFYRDKHLFYESVYYMDFILPEIKKVYIEDSTITKIFLLNEFNYDNENSLRNNIDNIEKFYKNQKYKSINNIDYINANIHEADKQLHQFTNKHINNIIFNNSKSFSFENNKFIRKYMPIYNISSSYAENNVFLVGAKLIKDINIFSYYFNLIILSVYNLLLIIVLFFIRKSKPY